MTQPRNGARPRAQPRPRDPKPADDEPADLRTAAFRARARSAEQWGRTYRWALEGLRGNANAVHLYAWLSARYGYPDRAEHPTREQLANETGMSVRSVQRATTALRAIGALRTIARRQPGTGFVIGAEYVLLTAPPEDDHDPSLSATSDTQGFQAQLGLNATGGTQDTEPECQNRQSLSATGGPAKIRSVQTDQKILRRASESGTQPQASSIGKTPEQSRQKRATTRDVAMPEPGWCTWTDRAELDAYLATAPLGSKFASPPLVRKFGYTVFDAHPNEIFDVHVAQLVTTVRAEGLATSEDVCRLAMADVYTARQPRDRAWDRGADMDRRRARR